MKPITRKNLILSLIKDDLINTKLVGTLNNLGLMADHYRLHASTTVINLVGIKAPALRWEQIHEGYLDLTQKVLSIDVHESPHLLDNLSEEIYNHLEEQKEKNDKANRIR